MRLLLAVAALPLLAATPVSAAGIATTHEELAVPPGKLNAKAFRPLKAERAVANALNPSGSRLTSTLPARSAEPSERPTQLSERD